MTTYDSYPDHDPEMTDEQIEQTATAQWRTDQRLEAMETVLGRRIDARDLPDNPDLASVFMISDPDEAYAGLLLVKTLEQLAAERKQ